MIVLIAAAVLPAAFLLYQVYKMDTIEKEPWSILRKLLLWGALSGIPAALVESLLTGLVGNLLEEGTLLYNFIFGFIVAALVEESFKFFFLYKFTFKSPHFNYRFDGVVYAVFVSMGFAILENVLYVFQGGLGVAVSRALLALPLHYRSTTPPAIGARGIRTPGILRYNGFQDRPSTTALVSLQ